MIEPEPVRQYNLACWNVSYLRGRLDDALRRCANDEAEEIAKDLRLWEENRAEVSRLLAGG